MSTTNVMSKDFNDADHPFYNYTSGRWLYNERLRLAERRHHFEIDALYRLCAKAVGKSPDDVGTFMKLAEGGSYRVFEVGFHDGLGVIVRLPYSSTIPRSHGIASEAATMAFLRCHGFPVPEVYDWDSSTTNAIGSEYMIMEKCPGQELDRTWYSMEPPERKAIVEKIVEFESRLLALDIPANGSIYFKNSLDASIETIDIPANGKRKGSQEFCIGPSTERLWWYQWRDELDVNRGPWTSTVAVVAAIAERELAWLRKFGKARLPREPAYRSIHKHKLADPQEQICNLLQFTKIAEQLVPADRKFHRPSLRHPDFSPNNIFISDSGDISGVIDWQHSVCLPLILQAKMHRHFQNFGDEDSETFKPPQLPAGFDSMKEDEKLRACDLYRRRQIHYYYLGFTHRDNQDFFQAMLSPDIVATNRLFEATGRPWEGDSVSLKAELIRTMTEWPGLVPSSGVQTQCPIKYTQAEIDECLALDARQKEVDEQMQRVRDHLGVNIDGWVPHDLFDATRITEQSFKEQMLEAVDTEDDRRDIIENWPFQDHEEID